MPGEPTKVLAEFAAALTYDKIPERVRDVPRSTRASRSGSHPTCRPPFA